MKYYSTNRKASDATLEEAVVKGLAADRGHICLTTFVFCLHPFMNR